MSKGNKLQKFITKCEMAQNTLSDISATRKRFEGYQAFAISPEETPHAKLFFHILEKEKDARLLLYEYPLDKLHESEGNTLLKVDFVYLKGDKIVLIEAKHLMYESGRTRRSKRTRDRKKIFDQLEKRRNYLIDNFGILPSDIVCKICTNDNTLCEYAKSKGMDVYYFEDNA